MSQILQQLREILKEHFLIQSSVVQPSKTFESDLGMSSLEFTELVVYLEDTYNIQLSDMDLSRVRNVRDLVWCVEQTVK
ncbi:acyl carrier protein [Cytophagaceae bacterium DM2B3-1]|uniref:Acyl carrier protein n=1 Tax=Xanthocytophaga flava TaxID=3048013 RepID=A0ABT7CK03_9BACT|nr:acyl carrier protein [Xanthocytophaga flavus]MDJ1468461.1 acyl carrier protein [Xanthocytophaga flavus]MDJ1493357.1 acyl carrier protein [Xanthocytophaga flavus]